MDAPIRFTQVDLDLFAQATGDVNPLHMSAGYASRTAYGQQVVFGVLGAIACLGRIPTGSVQGIGRLTAEFLRPMFLAVDYRVEAVEQPNGWRVRLYDGSVRVLSLTLVKSETPLDFAAWSNAVPQFGADRAVFREQLSVGLSQSGGYCAHRAGVQALANRFQISAPVPLLELLGFFSYLIGMELPGETALFFKLAVDLTGASWVGPLEYSATVQSVNSTMGHASIRVKVHSSGEEIARAECGAFIRPPLPAEPKVEPLATSDALKGATMVVIGSSRGLGAAFCEAGNARGATVFGLARSKEDQRTIAGDAADPAAMDRLIGRVHAEGHEVNILICNACPPIVPLRIEDNARERIAGYLDRAARMVLTPMSAFLPALERNGGHLIVISSSAVLSPVREWPHYGAAKAGVEMLAQVAAQQYPNVRVLIVRPEKLLTDLVGTPVGRLGASSPAALASQVLDGVALESGPGCRILGSAST